MNDILVFEYDKGVKQVYPANNLVKNWLFKEDEEDEATLANSLAKVAEKNGLSTNDLQHLFPYVLRMLKSEINWSK
jgi:hypothetical protein